MCLYKKNNHKNHGQEVYKLEGNYAKSTGVDDEQVEEWLHEDARNQEYYEKAKYYFDNYYSGEKEIHQINMKKAWDDFLVYTKKSRNNIWKRYLQYVAGVVMLLGVGVALLLLVGKSEAFNSCSKSNDNTRNSKGFVDFSFG